MRHCYVVVSEIAKVNGKGATVRSVKMDLLAALVTAAVMFGSWYAPGASAQEADEGKTIVISQSKANEISTLKDRDLDWQDWGYTYCDFTIVGDDGKVEITKQDQKFGI